jgi:dihydroneopterin aldolase
MLTIKIKDLEVFLRVGVPDAERAAPQRLLVTVVLTLNHERAAQTDDLGDTVDYSQVAQYVLGLGTERSWRLIEKLAGDIADELINREPVEAVAVKIKKFIISEARWVSVTLERRRR